MVTAEVVRAKGFASEMLRWESRGPGDTENAMRRLSRRHGIDYSAFWSLRYRAPKRIWADVYTAFQTAYENERQRQLRKLAHDVEITEAIAGPEVNSAREARALLRSTAEQMVALVDEIRK